MIPPFEARFHQGKSGYHLLKVRCIYISLWKSINNFSLLWSPTLGSDCTIICDGKIKYLLLYLYWFFLTEVLARLSIKMRSDYLKCCWLRIFSSYHMIAIIWELYSTKWLWWSSCCALQNDSSDLKVVLYNVIVIIWVLLYSTKWL